MSEKSPAKTSTPATRPFLINSELSVCRMWTRNNGWWEEEKMEEEEEEEWEEEEEEDGEKKRGWRWS